MERIVFGQKDIANVLARMTASELDGLPFGAIELSAAGVVLSYSQREGELTGRRPEDVIGKDFFAEVAPCTRRAEFQGAFQEGVRSGDLNTIFEYTFDYKMNPTRVKVHMIRSVRNDRSFWIFVRRL